MHSRCMHYSYITQTLVIPNLGVGVHLQVPIVAALCQQLRLSHCSTFNPYQPDTCLRSRTMHKLKLRHLVLVD